MAAKVRRRCLNPRQDSDAGRDAVRNRRRVTGGISIPDRRVAGVVDEALGVVGGPTSRQSSQSNPERVWPIETRPAFSAGDRRIGRVESPIRGGSSGNAGRQARLT